VSRLLAAVLGFGLVGAQAQPREAAADPASPWGQAGREARRLTGSAQALLPGLLDLAQRSRKAGFKSGEIDEALWQLARDLHQTHADLQALGLRTQRLERVRSQEGPQAATDLLQASSALRQAAAALQDGAQRAFREDLQPQGFTHQGWNIKREAKQALKAAVQVEQSCGRLAQRVRVLP